MKFENCKLYNITRKRDLCRILNVDVKTIKENINSYKPYICKGNKKRLIEPTYNKKLKLLHNKIHQYLKEMEFDNNVFGGIKGKCYLDNGIYHLNNNYVLALDISKFFPCITREKIYQFYYKKLRCSPDVSKILSDICSVNLNKIECDDVKKYLLENDISNLNHIPTGASFSSLLAYLVNIEMFYEINDVCEKNNCKVSYYIDDIVISCKKKVKSKLLNEVLYIVKKHGYRLQLNKLKKYNINQYKRVTGAIISKNAQKLVYANKITYKLKRIKNDNLTTIIDKKQKIRGLQQVLFQTDSKNVLENTNIYK